MTSIVDSHSTHVAEFQEGGVCMVTAAHTEQEPQVMMPRCPWASAAGPAPPNPGIGGRHCCLGLMSILAPWATVSQARHPETE